MKTRMIYFNNCEYALTYIQKTSFFKVFKVRLDTQCPFWKQNFACVSRGCATEECVDDEVPH